MPVFEYQATDSQGQPVTGTLIGATLTAAASDLALRGLNVSHLAVSEVAGDPVPQDFQPAPPPGESEYVYDKVVECPRGEPLMEQRSAVMTEIVGPLVGRISLQQLLFFFRQLGTL